MTIKQFNKKHYIDFVSWRNKDLVRFAHVFYDNWGQPCGSVDVFVIRQRWVWNFLFNKRRKEVSTNVNHPKHYGGKDNPYETIKVIEAWGLDNNFNLGNTIKYISRADKKNNNVEDLKKARWYLDREIAKLEGQPDPNQLELPVGDKNAQ